MPTKVPSKLTSLRELVDEYIELYSEELVENGFSHKQQNSLQRKLAVKNPILNEGDKALVRHILEDQGELYYFAGTSSGFSRDSYSSEKEVKRAQRFGKDAFKEGRLVGAFDKL